MQMLSLLYLPENTSYPADLLCPPDLCRLWKLTRDIESSSEEQQLTALAGGTSGPPEASPTTGDLSSKNQRPSWFKSHDWNNKNSQIFFNSLLMPDNETK